MKKNFSVVSLGCFRNTYDSEIIANKYCGLGYEFREAVSLQEEGPYDLLVINTCGFIDKAKEESIEVIKEAIDLKKEGKVNEILVFGCLVQRNRKELENFFPEVDHWQGILELNKIYPKRKKLSPSAADFLKISEGCLNRCSFCAIPSIKGPLVSKSDSEIINEVKYLEGKNIKELSIIGQDITSWGQDFKEKKSLTFLIKKIVKETKNIKWIRLIYTHPKNFTDELIKVVADNEKICKYIDLPIQHINDRILKSMNRKTTKRYLIDLIDKIRKTTPECVLRTSVIVGFPGETEKEFKELLKFIKDAKFERLGAFIYSREEGTPAARLPGQIHHKTKEKRYNQIMYEQQKIAQALNNRFINKELEILIEESDDRVGIGRSQYDAPEVDGVVYVKRKGLRPGEFYKAKIVDTAGYDLIAE